MVGILGAMITLPDARSQRLHRRCGLSVLTFGVEQ